MDTLVWRNKATELLEELKHIDLGYPIGSNLILPAEASAIVDDILQKESLEDIHELRDFYSMCDGLRWPDVHNGYFIFRVCQLSKSDPLSLPHTIMGLGIDKVLPFGSSGGGDLFVVVRKSLTVLALPPGPIHDGVYDASNVHVRMIASSFSGFLERLLSDLEAVVKNIPSHRFIV